MNKKTIFSVVFITLGMILAAALLSMINAK
jgi:preprotein translocase subunit Sec63